MIDALPDADWKGRTVFGYYRKRLIWITERLRHQEKHLDDLQNLAEMQVWLVRQITTAEVKQRRFKDEKKTLKNRLRDRLSKADSLKTKARVDWIDRRIERLRDLTYVFRCFGDGIAFLYLDRYAAKPLAFEGEGALIKRSAGSLSGKAGLKNELAFLASALGHGVPAVLCDLTNSIRHGDVCLLGNSDPYVYEVKSGLVSGGRIDRQKLDVGRLNAFFENDGGEVLGAPYVGRSALGSKQIDHVDTLNATAEFAMAYGHCVSSPEPGVVITAKGPGYRGLPMDGEALSGKIGLYSWNGRKMARQWLSYQPFTLMIRDAELLFQFLSGTLFIVVLIDYDKLIQAFASHGLSAELNPDGYYFVSGSWPTMPEGKWGVSGHYVDRLGLELLSLKWIADEQSRIIWQMERNLRTGESTFLAPMSAPPFPERTPATSSPARPHGPRQSGDDQPPMDSIVRA